jgi:ketosteroid isomerase-like protein
MTPIGRGLCLIAIPLLLCACASAPALSPDPLRAQVYETERAFAGTMARRDLDAFAAFLADETVFFADAGAVRGKAAVVESWRRFYDPQKAAPFRWEPAQVEVLDSGTLALSTGPVHDADGKSIGTFTSIWRLEAPGQWRIIFDKGCPACDCKP